MHISTSAWTTACLAISYLPVVTAFYPYQPKYDDDDNAKVRFRRTLPTLDQAFLERRERRSQSISLPLRRVRIPSRRDNAYNIVNSKDPTQEDSVAIDQDGDDLSYMVAVTLGDSKEEYHLLMDSAASNTWVMGEDCKTDACGSHNTFGKGDSSSLKIEDTPFSVTYGTGSVSGILASDTLHIGPLSPSVTFGLATNVSDEFKSYPMDGILGIGRGDTSDGAIDAPQVMDVLKTSNLIKSKLYCIHLSRTVDGLNDGELDLGEVNNDRFDGELNYVKAVDNTDGFWKIGIDNVGVDGSELGLSGRTAILDSGTSFILMPEPDATALHNLIPGYKKSGETYTVPCDTQQVIWVGFGGQKYNISTKDYIGGRSSDGNCGSNIIGRQTFGDDQWLVGDVFLKNVYSVFDFDNLQVGFGVKGSDSPTPTSTAASGSATATASTAGPSATGSSSSANPTPESVDAPGRSASASASPTGAAFHLSASTSVFTLSIFSGLLALLI